MTSLTIRNIDPSVKDRLRLVAAANGRSMEEEVRQLLKNFVLREKSGAGIGSRIHRRFAAAGGVDLPEVPRSYPRDSEMTQRGKTQ